MGRILSPRSLGMMAEYRWNKTAASGPPPCRDSCPGTLAFLTPVPPTQLMRATCEGSLCAPSALSSPPSTGTERESFVSAQETARPSCTCPLLVIDRAGEKAGPSPSWDVLVAGRCQPASPCSTEVLPQPLSPELGAKPSLLRGSSSGSASRVLWSF